MASEEHLAILRQGVDAWNKWRADPPEKVPDLSWANLSEANLSGVNFRGTYLYHAELSGADLSGSNFGRSNLSYTNLREANLSGAEFLEAYLFGAHLEDANLDGADVSAANLHEAHLRSANLHGAELKEVNLYGADLEGADLGDSVLGFTSLANLDLSVARGLGTVVHENPSSVGIDTLARTLRGSGGQFTEEQLIFFESAGVPHTLLEYLPGILESSPIQFFTCFISYSTEDETFADQLNQDLNTAGIKTWKWDRDAVRGRDLHQSIDRAIRQYDKTILICSVNSLNSPQVEPEIVAALDKEKRIKANNAERRREALAAGKPPPQVDADVLIPIRLDNTIFDWESHLKIEVSRRMISDFTDAPPDSEKYQNELQKLIHALNPQTWPPQLTSANASV